MVYDVLEYVHGFPLAIKVLGSFLFDRDVFEWRSALARLKENSSKDIINVLQLSFDGLKKMKKEIFLDIACFNYSSVWNNNIEKILEYQEFYLDISMKVLIEKSLISRDCWGTISMHDLMRELDRSIVQEKSPKELRKWSKL